MYQATGEMTCGGQSGVVPNYGAGCGSCGATGAYVAGRRDPNAPSVYASGYDPTGMPCGDQGKAQCPTTPSLAGGMWPGRDSEWQGGWGGVGAVGRPQPEPENFAQHLAPGPYGPLYKRPPVKRGQGDAVLKEG
jgi:hypothetical protein